MKSETIYFVSDEFVVREGEPVPGEALAHELKKVLNTEGFSTSEAKVIDGLWRFTLVDLKDVWVGCKGYIDLSMSEEYFEEGEEGVTWSCFVASEESISVNSLFENGNAEMFSKVIKVLKRYIYANQEICIVREVW